MSSTQKVRVFRSQSRRESSLKSKESLQPAISFSFSVAGDCDLNTGMWQRLVGDCRVR